MGTDKHGFGIMVGPMGSGKTTFVLKLCNEFPQRSCITTQWTQTCSRGILEELANAAAIKITPSSIFDGIFRPIILCTIVSKKTNKQEAAIRTIFGTLKQSLKTVANKYKSKHGRTPTLFLDGMDILAKGIQTSSSNSCTKPRF